MKPFAIVAVAAASFLTAASASGQVMSSTAYVAAAGASDLYERQSSQIVLQTTQDPKIQAYAAEMIADHGKSTAQVKAAAAKSKVAAAPPQLTPLQSELIAELTAESGPARDATYIAQQKASHNQALAVQQTYASDGTAPALRAAAIGIVPVVEHRIEMLKAM